MRVIVNLPKELGDVDSKILMGCAATAVNDAKKEGHVRRQAVHSVRVGLKNRKVATLTKKTQTGYSVTANWQQEVGDGKQGKN